jgi:hypothetical protein
MITKEYLIEAYRNAIDIAPFDGKGDNSVFLGFISITEAVGLDAILTAYTSYIDKLLKKLPLSSFQYIELITARAFTYAEYQALWQVRTKDMRNCKICQVLLINSEEERRLFTSVAKDESHESFVQFLQVYTKNNNHFLHNLLYESYT